VAPALKNAGRPEIYGGHKDRRFGGGGGWGARRSSDIRCLLGAARFVFGKLVKNGWLDGIHARVENSTEFLPFASHQHWHAVGSSICEHDPQKIADFIQTEVNGVLANTCPGIYADVLVATSSTPEDLRRWINYITKTVDLVGAVESVYNRYPGLRETDVLFQEFYRELQLYPCRSESVFGMIRCPQADERGKHTYQLRHRYVRGTHNSARVRSSRSPSVTGCGEKPVLTEPGSRISRTL